MVKRNWWRASVVCAVLAASMSLMGPARTAEVPVVTSPTAGAEVPLGFAGPVTIDYSGVAPGTYKVRVTAYEGSDLHEEKLPDVQVDADTGEVTFSLTDSLDKPGEYAVNTWLEGTWQPVTSRFTVPGGEPPVVLSPGRRVPLGEPWTLTVDWSNAPVGYYDLDLWSVRPLRPLDWWDEMFPNHEDRTTTVWPMDPIMERGRHYVRLGSTRWYFQVS